MFCCDIFIAVGGCGTGTVINNVPVPILQNSVADPDPGSGIRDPVLFYPPDPGSGMEQWSDPGSGISKQNL
jgi:hypothetical protein